MPVEQIEISEREKLALQLVADRLGVSVDEAAALMAKACLERRMHRRTSGGAQVLRFRKR